MSIKGSKFTSDLLDVAWDIQMGKSGAVKKLKKYVESGRISAENYNKLIEEYGLVKKPPKEVHMLFKVVVSIIFCILAWFIIPLSNLVKAALFIFSAVFALLVMLDSIEFIEKKANNAAKAVGISSLMFVVIPGLLVSHYFIQRDAYLSTAPYDNKVTIKSSIDIECLSNSGVGSEFIYRHYINGTQFSAGEAVQVSCRSPLHIETVIIEKDDINDIGESRSRALWSSYEKDYSKTKKVENTVSVIEKGGKRNKGASALFKVKYSVKRVVPKDMNFWDMLYYGGNIPYTVFITTAFAIDVLLIIVFFIIFKRTESLKEKGD